MNPLSRLLGGRPSTVDDGKPFEKLSKKEQAEILKEEKSARIKHHRDNVRNGPVRYRNITVGQQKRAAVRGQKTSQRKATERHRRNFMDNRLDFAVTRAKLQFVGVIPFTDQTRKPTADEKFKAATWLIQHFAPRNTESEIEFSDSTLDEAISNAMSAMQVGRPSKAKV